MNTRITAKTKEAVLLCVLCPNCLAQVAEKVQAKVRSTLPCDYCGAKNVGQ